LQLLPVWIAERRLPPTSRDCGEASGSRRETFDSRDQGGVEPAAALGPRAAFVEAILS
jgi:hypothetical protein